MLAELCKEIRNWFDTDRYFGEFTIENDGTIGGADFELQDGQYFRIVGSTFNDGVYQYPVDTLREETFNGAIWAMAVPADIINLAAKIKQWNDQWQDKVNSPFVSESFGGYSYSKASGADGSSNITWKDVFRDEINRWRKI